MKVKRLQASSPILNQIQFKASYSTLSATLKFLNGLQAGRIHSERDCVVWILLRSDNGLVHTSPVYFKMTVDRVTGDGFLH